MTDDGLVLVVVVDSEETLRATGATAAPVLLLGSLGRGKIYDSRQDVANADTSESETVTTGGTTGATFAVSAAASDETVADGGVMVTGNKVRGDGRDGPFCRRKRWTLSGRSRINKV